MWWCCVYNWIADNLIDILQVAAFLVAVVALVVSWVALSQKKGCKIRCGIGLATSIESEGYYVKEVIVENLKDKSIAIYDMYLRIGVNTYIDLFNRPHHPGRPAITPDIIPPFEIKVYSFYPPVYYDCHNIKITNIDNLITRKDAKIVLSTNTGKVIADTNMKLWFPMSDFWGNHRTLLVRPQRLSYKGDTYKDRSYGRGVLYLAVITTKDCKEHEYPIYKDPSNKVGYFYKVKFNKECLANKDKVYQFLEEQKSVGNIDYEKLEIIDWSEEVKTLESSIHGEDEIQTSNWFQYRIIGKIETLYHNLKEFGNLKGYKIYKTSKKKDNIMKNNLTFWVAIIALVLSLGTIGVIIVNAWEISVIDSNTFISTMVGLMTLVFTLLIGYQIYNALEIKEQLSKISKLQEELQSTKKELQKEIHDAQKSLSNLTADFNQGIYIMQARQCAMKPAQAHVAFIKMLSAIQHALDVDHKDDGYEWMLEELKSYMLCLNNTYPFTGASEKVVSIVNEYKSYYKDIDNVIRKHENYYIIRTGYELLMTAFDKRLECIAQMKPMSLTEIDKVYNND